MKRFLIIPVLLVIGLTACELPEDKDAASASATIPAPATTESATGEQCYSTACEPTASTVDAVIPATPGLSTSQENAIESAQSYIDTMPFSRLGLIHQLSSEYGAQFPLDEATFAVDSITVDWNEQAARAAQSYLDSMSFSCTGLIHQLSSEYGAQFTAEQATYGATQVGLC